MRERKTTHITNDLEDKITRYDYHSKPSMMTQAETKVFRKFNQVFDKKFYVIPQVHLPTILGFQIKGQN